MVRIRVKNPSPTLGNITPIILPILMSDIKILMSDTLKIISKHFLGHKKKMSNIRSLKSLS